MPPSLASLVAAAHEPSLAGAEGCVFQVWNDGEITSQKSGRLLWRRTLHQIYPPLPPGPGGRSHLMPAPMGGGASCAYVEYRDALRIRAEMAGLDGRGDPLRASEELADLLRDERLGVGSDPEAVVRRCAGALARRYG